MQQILTTRARASSGSGLFRQIVRNHLSHGSPDAALASAPAQTGPRDALQLGFDSAKASQNILRLLESSHGTATGSYFFGDTLSTAWHSSGLRWTYDDDGDGDGDGSGGWKCCSYNDEEEQQQMWSSSSASTTAPRLEWLNFSDDRTALAKIEGTDGRQRYVSMLRLDPDAKIRQHQSMNANDGWCIVREVRGSSNNNPQHGTSSSINSVGSALENYLSIEHGGGDEDNKRAQELFAPEASLITVGTAPLEEDPTAWSSPSGTFLNISLDDYLKGVQSQTPHCSAAKVHDVVVQIDTMPSAAAATVHVGNGAQSTLFVDHLLLGYHEDRWRILSKTFSTRPWPA